MLFASVTKGFKSGGFNSLGVLYHRTLTEDNGTGQVVPDIATDARPDPYRPETVWSYEAGLKGNTPDNRVRYDLSAYHYRYKDLQLGYFDAGEKVDNAGRVKGHGVEGSLQAALSDNFDLILSGSFNSNEINDANIISPGSDGNRLGGTPKYKMAGLLSYHAPVSDTGRDKCIDRLGRANQPFPWPCQRRIDQASGILGHISLRVGYEDEAGWSITAYVENVFDTLYLHSRI